MAANIRLASRQMTNADPAPMNQVYVAACYEPQNTTIIPMIAETAVAVMAIGLYPFL